MVSTLNIVKATFPFEYWLPFYLFLKEKQLVTDHKCLVCNAL